MSQVKIFWENTSPIILLIDRRAGWAVENWGCGYLWFVSSWSNTKIVVIQSLVIHMNFCRLCMAERG